MKIIAPSQINNYKILEEVLEEIYLSIVERIQEVGDALDLYSLSSSNILSKLGILGFENISIGHYLSLNIDDNYYKYVSPLFYKAFRKLNQHRGNKQALDYILHSGNLIDTLNKSNNDYVKDNIFSDSASFFDFESFRDNQFEFSDIGDGYIIVPYVSKGGQKFKNFLAKNPLIFNYLPAGYTFIFLSDYRNAFFNGVLQHDNLLNTEDEYNDWSNIPSEKDIFWELPTRFELEEELEYKEDEYRLYKRDLYYYDPEKSSPTYFEDFGRNFTIVFHPRFPNHSIYDYSSFKDVYGGSVGYIDGLNDEKNNEAYTNYLTGMGEADINNQLEYSDIWQGDYLEGNLENENVIPETVDHIRGIKSIHSTESSFLSMFSRGESLYDRYKSRYLDIVAKNNPNDGTPKEEIISDYQYIDCFVSQSFIPEPEPPTPVTASPLCGSMGLDYSEEIVVELSDSVKNETLEFDTELRDIKLNKIPERIEDETIEFTTELRGSLLPESGTVEQYIEKYSYIVLSDDTGELIYNNTYTDIEYAGVDTLLLKDTDIEYAGVDTLLLQDDKLLVIEEEI